jgi:hypothetical protein
VAVSSSVVVLLYHCTTGVVVVVALEGSSTRDLAQKQKTHSSVGVVQLILLQLLPLNAGRYLWLASVVEYC